MSIYSLSALHTFAKLVNGKFRTPKLEALHRFITWINNYGKFEHLELLPVDDSNLRSNAWLAGYADCDSNFLISFSSELGIANNIHLTFSLSQRKDYHRSSLVGISYFPILYLIATAFKTKPIYLVGINYFPILYLIATAFKTKPTYFERKRESTKTGLHFIEEGYLVTAKSLASRIEVINYFTNFPLLSSKRLDYLY